MTKFAGTQQRSPSGVLLRALLLTTALPFAAASRPAVAQTGDSVGQLEQIVVTARRREEALKDVPISVTAISADTLDLHGAADVTALQRTTPNLTLQVARGTNSTLTAFIRGVGQQDPLWGFEPGVGLYVDDVYVARPQGAILDIFDIDHVEVLRGPQGTLYGRNTIGGAVKYVTRRLGPTPHFNVRVEGGTYGEGNIVVSGSAPIVDTLSIGGAFARYKHDGYGTNHFTGAASNNKDVITGRVSIEWTPTTELFVRASYDRFEDKSNVNHGHRETVEPNTGLQVYPNKYDTDAGLGDYNKVITEGSSLLAQWTASDMITLKSITAFRRGRTDTSGIDFDGTPQPFLDVGGYGQALYRDHQFSEEAQALLQADRWQGVAGLYFMRATASGQFDTVLGRGLSAAATVPVPTALTALTQYTAGSVKTKSFAAFGDVSVNITNNWVASVGGRWTQDDRSGTVLKVNYLFAIGSPIQHPYQPPIASAPGILTNYTNSASFKEFTPRASLTYKITSDVNVYAAYSKGFKSGGFDMRGDASSTPTTVNGYGPERVDSYELGLKGSLLERHVNFSAALFDAEYKGQQITTQIPRVTLPPAVVSFVDNAGSSTIRGGELEISALLAKEWALNGTLGFADPKFNQYIAFIPNAAGVFVATDVSTQRQFQNTPKWNGSIGLTWTHDLGGTVGSLAVNGAMNFRSKTNMFETPLPLLDQPGYQLFDADVVWTSESNRWRVGVHGRNLGNTRYRTGAYNFPGVVYADTVIGFYGPPRTVKVTAEFRY